MYWALRKFSPSPCPLPALVHPLPGLARGEG